MFLKGVELIKIDKQRLLDRMFKNRGIVNLKQGQNVKFKNVENVAECV